MTGLGLAADEAAGWWRLTWGRRGQMTRDVQVATRAELEDHVARLKGKGVVTRERLRLHTCSVCRRTAPWVPAWTWYGSIADMDAGILVPKLCSDDCRARARDAKIVPRNARMLDTE